MGLYVLSDTRNEGLSLLLGRFSPVGGWMEYGELLFLYHSVAIYVAD